MTASLPHPPDPRPRSLFPQDFEITDWESLQPYLDALLNEEPEGLEGLLQWMGKLDEVIALLEEDYARRFISMSRNTLDQDCQERYSYFNQYIRPHKISFIQKTNQKIYQHPAFEQLPEAYFPAARLIRQQIDLYRDENIPLKTREQELGQQYSSLTGGLTLDHHGKELTLQQALKLLESQDRELRKEIWKKVGEVRISHQEQLDEIFDEMVTIRHQIAQNAGYETYTEYKFADRGRFDYDIKDTLDFHASIEKVARPVLESFYQERKKRLGLDVLRPYDLQVDIFGSDPLNPFQSSSELFAGVERIFKRLNPELADVLGQMYQQGFMDLESRKGKMSGGYNYPLMESGVSFIFMNAVGAVSDVITLLHESGHAVQSSLIKDLPISQRDLPSEVAELAAMSMELLCLDYYDEFFPDPAERIRAQKNQLMRCITVLCWIATIDAFQQWVYDHPDHSRAERRTAWKDIYFRFHGQEVEWEGYEPNLIGLWQKQPHVFEYPFYYIEYGIAQLGALSIWQNYRQNPEKTMNQYLGALASGYQKPIPDIYQKAGIKFDFSEQYVREAISFCLQAYQDYA